MLQEPQHRQQQVGPQRGPDLWRDGIPWPFVCADGSTRYPRWNVHTEGVAVLRADRDHLAADEPRTLLTIEGSWHAFFDKYMHRTHRDGRHWGRPRTVA